MKILSVDEKWRVRLPKEFRELLKLKPGERLLAEGRTQSILLRRAKGVAKRDPLIWDLNHPVKARRLLSKAELEKIEDEMWLP